LPHEGAAALIGKDGTRIDLPLSVHEILMRALEKMQENKAVAGLPRMEELSTQAADLLGFSRQFFVRECEAHELAFDYTGAHRRVLLLDFKKLCVSKLVVSRSCGSLATPKNRATTTASSRPRNEISDSL
jgi:hypothetical protein